MRIEKLAVKNLRSIRELSVGFDEVTALLGGNNAGKSTVLRALELFFEAAPRLSLDDYHNRGDDDVEVIVEFGSLVPAELEEFGTAVDEGKLTVKRVFSKQNDNNLHYEALAKSYPPFAEARAHTGKADRIRSYNSLVAETEGLEAVRSADAADQAMLDWEANNPEKLKLAFRRGFFGAPNVASGKLKKKMSVHLVPAVADANEETSDPKKSPIISLLREISRQIYENKAEVREFVEAAKRQFSELVDPARVPELGGISDLLTSAVRRYYKDSKLIADWQLTDGVAVEYPSPTIRVEDQGFLTGLENVGHGLQRASLFAIIQFLAERSFSEDQPLEFDEPQSDILLLIEEPEIYQHPHKQLVISNAFHAICDSYSRATGIRFQIVFTTHSEKFVGLHKFQSARILRKKEGFGSPSHTANAVSLAQSSEYFARLLNKEPMEEGAFEAKMHVFSREICEGFFADKVILVEGVTDKAVLEGVYRSKNTEAVAEGIAIVPVDGKTKMDKPLYVFSQLGIPTYPIFDSDFLKSERKRKPETNRLLQQIAGVEEPQDFPDGVFPEFSAFHGNLEKYIRGQIGEDQYERKFADVCDDLGLSIEDLCKTPLAVMNLVEAARAEGTTFPYFDQIVEAVDKLG